MRTHFPQVSPVNQMRVLFWSVSSETFFTAPIKLSISLRLLL